MFLNEFEVLDIRLRELDSVVDRFVLVESAETHSGNFKPYYFDEKKYWFQKWAHKIIYVKVEKIPVDYPHLPVPYAREQSNRDCTIAGLSDLKADDYVMVSDVDEIPKAESIAEAKRLTDIHGSVWFHQPLFYYYLNNFVSNCWNGTRMVAGSYLKNPDHRVHMCRSVFENNCVLNDAGWHFSWLGNAERLAYKLNSYMHQEWNHPIFNNRENFEKSLATGSDFWGRKDFPPPQLISLETLPQCVRDNPSSYAQFLKSFWS